MCTIPASGSALRQLGDLGQEPGPGRWQWGIVKVEPIGRIVLPPHARVALATTPADTEGVRGRCRRVTLVLRRGDVGAPIAVDSRGRLYLPIWLRQANTRSDSFLVGTCTCPQLVIVAPVGLLDDLGDLLAGGPRSRPHPRGTTRG